MYMLFLLLLLTLHLIGQTNGEKSIEETKKNLERGEISCNNGWIPFTAVGSVKFTHCFKILSVFRMTWQQAEESCRQVGKDGHLISIQTIEQLERLTEAITEELEYKGHSLYSLFPKNSPWFDSGWWIGLGQLCPNREIDHKPIFRWTDGNLFDNDKLTIVNLKLNLPKSNKWDDHYCIFYDYQKPVPGIANHRMFNVSTCSDRRKFICQMPAFLQDKISVDNTIVAEEKVKIVKSESNELTEEFPCGKDPLFCPLKTSQGTVCYRLQNEPYYWEQAVEECDAQYQSDLTSLHSKEEVNFVYEMVQLQPSINGETKYWIGLHRRNAQNQYEWSDGSSFDYLLERISNEDPDEERGTCVAIQFNVSTKLLQKQPIYNFFGIPMQMTKNIPAYFWTHQRCDNRHLAICRKPGFNYHITSDKSAKEERRLKKHNNWICSNEYKLFRGMCYKVYGTKDNGVTFSEAIRRCKNEKANLISITDIYENGFAVSMLQNLNSNAWIGMDMTDGRVRWIDGEPLKLIRFGPDSRIVRIGSDRHIFQNIGQTGFSNEACVTLDATNMIGYWNIIFNKTNYVFAGGSTRADNKSNQCDSMELPYICEKYADESVNTVRKKKTCHEIDDVQYCFLLNDPNKHINGHYNFMEASEICATLATKYTNYGEKYGQLAQADNIFEWLFLTSLALENDYDEFFMGIRFRKSIGFERMDKLRLHLAPWDVGEPNLKNGDCVVLRIGKNGPAWYIDDCMKHKPIVCRLTNEEPMSMIPQTVRCPDGKEDWILGETHCYYLVSNSSMFSSGFKADHDCFKYFNASLASFETENDLELFKNHILHNELSSSNALIGLVRQQHGSYAWKDLSPVTFLNWGDDEPADVKGRIVQQCVKMQLNGNYTWHSISCWQSTHFICSTPVVNVQHNLKNEDDKTEKPSPSSHLSNDKGKKDSRKLSHDDNNHAGNISTDNQTLLSPMLSSSSSQSISAITIFGEFCLVLTIVLIIISGLHLWKRNRRLRLGNQRIIQFDQLQNEEENEI